MTVFQLYQHTEGYTHPVSIPCCYICKNIHSTRQNIHHHKRSRYYHVHTANLQSGIPFQKSQVYKDIPNHRLFLYTPRHFGTGLCHKHFLYSRGYHTNHDRTSHTAFRPISDQHYTLHGKCTSRHTISQYRTHMRIHLQTLSISRCIRHGKWVGRVCGFHFHRQCSHMIHLIQNVFQPHTKYIHERLSHLCTPQGSFHTALTCQSRDQMSLNYKYCLYQFLCIGDFDI